MRTHPIFAPFRRVNSLLKQIPGPQRRFIGNTLKLTPIFVLLFLHFPYQIMHTNGSSMSPFLNPNNAPHLPQSRDMILVRRLSYFDLWGYWLSALSLRAMGHRPDQALQRGEIVVFSTPHDPSKIAVKRIVGLPGDKIRPLEGFEGGDEVIVQHHHMWVEGDADDREKSRDSNWYGQISQNLVIGRVVAILEPWWSPRWLRVDEHEWPARQKGRVTENAVADTTGEPFGQVTKKDWLDGKGDDMLLGLEKRGTWLTNRLITSEKKRQETAALYAAAWKERGENDPTTKQITGNIVETLHGIFTKAGLELVLDEHHKPHLIQTKEGEAMAKEAWRKKPIEESYSPEELLQARRAAAEQALQKQLEDLEHYDEWAWYDRYKPKSVVENRLRRTRKKFEDEQKEMEEKLERERQEAAARESATRVHGHHVDKAVLAGK